MFLCMFLFMQMFGDAVEGEQEEVNLLSLNCGTSHRSATKPTSGT